MHTKNMVLTELEKEILLHTLGIRKGKDKSFYVIAPTESVEWESLIRLEKLKLIYSFPCSSNPKKIDFCCTKLGKQVAKKILQNMEKRKAGAV